MLTSYWCNEEGGEIVIIDELYVKKEYRQHGYAKHFINWAENHFKGRAVEMTLEVLSDNAHAIELVFGAGVCARRLYDNDKKNIKASDGKSFLCFRH